MLGQPDLAAAQTPGRSQRSVVGGRKEAPPGLTQDNLACELRILYLGRVRPTHCLKSLAESVF